MPQSHPLISCLTITRSRPALLKRAIDCFNSQNYLNKELIILFEEDDKQTSEFIRSTSLSNNIRVIIVKKESEKKLGDLRNIAIQNATGEFICQWDDDDWYSCNRLQYQYDALLASGKEACVLTQWILFHTTDQKAYVSHARLWEGSILCRKETIMQRPYLSKSRGEDTDVISLLDTKGLLHHMNDAPHLYIYNFHGQNTWEYNHFKTFFRFSKILPPTISLEIRNALEQKANVEESSHIIENMFNNFMRDEISIQR